MMASFLSKHTLIVIYSLVFAGLVYGVYQTSGTRHFGELAIYYIALVGFYSVLSLKPVRSLLTDRFPRSKSVRWNFNINYLVAATILFIIFHFVYMSGSPALQALKLNYSEDVALLRASITDSAPKIILYLASISLKGLLPFILLYFLVKKKHLMYWIVLFAAVFYAFSLMQKSYIVGLLMPSLIYSLACRRFLLATKDLAIMAIVVFSLSLVANPRGGTRPTTHNGISDTTLAEPGEYKKPELIAQGLINRVMIVPGKMVSNWFDIIPSQKPFLRGDGYRLLALIRGRTFVNYSVDLYGIMFPKYVERGLHGTVNVASFVYDYANFGRLGLIMAGFILAMLLFLIEVFFSNDTVLKISLNLFPVLLLSSGAITTLLFSGGWGLLILMYYLFLKKSAS